MGLDMYLYAEVYVSSYSWSENEEAKKTFATITDAVDLTDFVCKDSPHLKVMVCVAYWRKANAIHGWFVEKIQGGADDCGAYPVTAQQLEELRDACKAVLAGGDKEEHDLVPKLGFFFGPTDDEAWYTKCLEYTIEQLDRVLKDYDGWAFQYRSSW